MNYAAMKECDENSPNHTYRAISLDKNYFDEQAALALKNVFFFLGLIFRYPDQIVYDEIRQHLKAFDGFFLEYGEGRPPLPPISGLQAEYISLFVNNKGFVPALPYASSHMDQGLLMGKIYFRIKQILNESGFHLDASASELEDHISILLESCADLVHALIEKKFDAPNNHQMIATLLEITSCIKNWVDDFAENIHSYASLDFYKVSGMALKNFFHDVDNIYEQALGMIKKINDSQG
jgi:putative dimethyl sulfoxide reductase chaperone